MTDKVKTDNSHPEGSIGWKRKTEVIVLMVLSGWIVGGTLHGLLGDTTSDVKPVVPESLIEEVVESVPGYRYYLVFDSGACGAPFHATVNYLYNRMLPERVAVLTSTESTAVLRGLREHTNATVVGGHDRLVGSVTEYVNALLIERTETGRLLTYSFSRPIMAEYVAVLDDVFGTSSQQAGSHGLPATGVERAKIQL